MKKIMAYILTLGLVLSVCTPFMVVNAAIATTANPYDDSALVEFANTPTITIELKDGATSGGSVACLTDSVVGGDDTETAVSQ